MTISLTISCPDCQTGYKISHEWKGKRIKCRKCGASFVGHAAAAPTIQPGQSPHEILEEYREEILRLRQRIRHLESDLDDETLFKEVSIETPSMQPGGAVEQIIELNDDELKTFKFPERRWMTITYTDLRGITQLCESLPPQEVRTLVNAYLEEITHAIEINNATVDKIVGDEIVAMYGAPVYHADHSLRAVKTACDQMCNLKSLQKSFGKLGKTMPDCSISIHTGDLVVGNMGSSSRQDYTALGYAASLTAKMCNFAHGREIIMTETTLLDVKKSIPQNWRFVEENLKNSPEMQVRTAKRIVSLEEKLMKKMYSIGPLKEDGTFIPQFAFRYLFAIEHDKAQPPLPVLQVMDLRKGRGELFLDEQIIKNDEGKIFGKFLLIEKIGKGAISEVWKARNEDGKIIALKLFVNSSTVTIKQLERFQKASEKLAELKHKNICCVHEVGEIEEITYIAMDYIDGISLSDLLRYRQFKRRPNISGRLEELQGEIKRMVREIKEKAHYVHMRTQTIGPGKIRDSERRKYQILPIHQTLTIISKICEAVQYAHEHGVLHRDLKPANILINKDGEPVITDFSLSKLETETEEGIDLTYKRKITGTIEYMSPDQIISPRSADARADIYSIGCILYQMISGRLSYLSCGDVEEDAKILIDYTPESPSRHNMNVDDRLERIILKSVHYDRNARYMSVSSMREELLRYGLGESVAFYGKNDMELLLQILKQNTSWVIVSVFSLILIGAFLFWL